MKRLRFIIIFHFLGLSCFAQPMSGTYIVGGPQGVFATPSLAVQELQQRGMSGPVTLKIYAGIYYEQIFIHNIPGSDYTNTLTIESESGRNDDVIITYDLQDINYSYIILIGDILYVVIRNLTFQPTGLYSTGLRASSNGLNVSVIKIINCVFNTCGCSDAHEKYSIETGHQYKLDSLIISGNTFNGCRAIDVKSAPDFNHPGTYLQVDHNRFYQNTKRIFSTNLDFCKFSNNSIFSCQKGTVAISTQSGTSQNTQTFLAENNNIILTDKWNFIFSHGFHPSIVLRNNIIHADSSRGILAYSGLLLYNNTLKVKEKAVYYIDKTVDVKNNIFIAIEGSVFYAMNGIGIVNSNNNVLWSPSVYPICVFQDTSVSAIPDFAAWQNMGMDTHTKWGIPLFSKPYDLHLQPGDTLARGAGTPIASVTHDIDGDLRNPLNPDIGADEVVIRPVLDEYYNACIGSPFMLDAGAGFSTYQWSTGATTQTITLQPSSDTATYSCTVTFGPLSGHKTTEVRWVDCTGIVKHDKTRLVIQSYPNPATRSITLQASEGNNLPEGILQIYNVQGIKYLEIPLSQHRNRIEVNISTLPTGIFLGRIIGHNGETGVFRFVKSH